MVDVRGDGEPLFRYFIVRSDRYEPLTESVIDTILVSGIVIKTSVTHAYMIENIVTFSVVGSGDCAG